MTTAAGGETAIEIGSSRLTSLAELDGGVRARIVEIRAGNRMTRRCLALGLRVGAELTVSHKRGRGVLVASDGNRVALGADMAERLLVERLS